MGLDQNVATCSHAPPCMSFEWRSKANIDRDRVVSGVSGESGAQRELRRNSRRMVMIVGGFAVEVFGNRGCGNFGLARYVSFCSCL
jgi:hypothetical protein